MKKLIALLLLSPLAFAEDIEFNLNCKITDQIIFQVKDGKTTRYSNYADEVKVGDNFSIDFKFQSYGDGYRLSIYSKELNLIIVSLESSFLIAKFNEYVFDRSNKGVLGNISGVLGRISSERIYIDDVLSTVEIKRYFKNDWQLLTTSYVSVNSTSMLTANCMNMPSKFDKMLKIIANASGELEQ